MTNTQINLFLGLFDELDIDTSNFRNIHKILESYTSQVKIEYQELYTSFVNILKLYIDKHEHKIKHLQSMVNNQSIDVKYTDLELDAMCLNAELEETKLKLETLQTNYNILHEMYIKSVNNSLELARNVDELEKQIKQQTTNKNN